MVKFILRPVSKVFDLLFLFYFLLALWMEDQTFFIHHVLQNLFGRLEIVPLPVKDFLANWFLLVIVQSIKIGMT